MVPAVGLRKRIVFLFLVTMSVFFALSIRLAYIQLVRGETLRAEALENRLLEVEVQAKRGAIYDRAGRELAISVSVDSLYAVPAEIEDPEEAARRLAPLLGQSEQDVYEKLTRHVSFSWVQRKLPDDVAREIRQLNLRGLYFTEESRRLYPKGALAAHILGIAGIDNQGLEGSELVFDELLSGEAGRIKVEFDAAGRELPQAVQQFVPPVDGASIALTIDENIQYVVERELDRAMLAHQAKAGYVIVMRPQTGEILAMAVRPHFDPNEFEKSTLAERRNRAISDTFPPGSVFKPITAAAALDAGLVTPNTPFYDPGYYRAPGHTITNWNRRGLGATTFAEGFQESANTIFAQLAEKVIGVDRFYAQLEAFGLTERTGIDLPGEGRGLLPPKEAVRPLDLAVMGFGQTLTVTPIQMITAMAAIANDGLLMRPQILYRVFDEHGETVQAMQPEPVRQAIAPETARTLRELMARVVSDGTGTRAHVDGYRVGGKTGTSQKVEDGRILPGHYIASFIGMIPIDKPEVVIYVVIDEPQGLYTGGFVAAPVFARIARDVMHYLDIPPQVDEDEATAPVHSRPADPTLVPDVVQLSVNEAISVLQYAGLAADVQGGGGRVTAQVPAPGVRVQAGATVILATDGALEQQAGISIVDVPDLRGLVRDEAAARLSAVNLRLDAHGEGRVVDQDPAPGSRVPARSFVRVYFEPDPDEGDEDTSVFVEDE